MAFSPANPSAGATHVDIACSPELVQLACRITNLPICVSAVDAELFLSAVEVNLYLKSPALEPGSHHALQRCLEDLTLVVVGTLYTGNTEEYGLLTCTCRFRLVLIWLRSVTMMVSTLRDVSSPARRFLRLLSARSE